MRRVGFLAVLLLSMLCGCARREPDRSQADKVYVPDEPTPVYVELPQGTQEDENLVFSGWTSAHAGQEEESTARYRDVSGLENVLALSSAAGEKEDVVTVPLRLCGQVELCAVDLKITFDKNRLEYIGVAEEDPDLMVNAKAEEGLLRINYLYPKNLRAEKDLCRLQFRVITQQTGETMIHMEVVEAVQLGDNGEVIICPAVPIHSTVWLNQKAGEAG